VKIIKPNSKDLEKLIGRFNTSQNKRVKERVDSILHDVRANGDEALLKYTKCFDGVKMTLKQMRVSESEKSAAFQDISPEFISTLKKIIANITKFYTKQQKRSWKQINQDGVFLGEKIDPLERVGVYVPAGTAPLVSCVYMSVLPARIAGVQDIVLVTPPDKNGHINPHILVVADLLKVNEIYKVGGAHAVAALAFGTKTIKKVDKIVGPGNNYVTEAKRQVFGYCDIDMLAGPTELVVIANRYSNVPYCIADLASQAEHFGGLAVLITPSKSLAKEVGSYNIRVNAIAPGYIETDMTKDLKQKDYFLKMIPFSRFGKPEEVAKIVSFLASEKAAYITGQAIKVDGGLAI